MATESHSWEEMQQAVERARAHAVAVMAGVAEADDRASAVGALAEIVGCSPELADQLLDAQLSQFIATSRSE